MTTPDHLREIALIQISQSQRNAPMRTATSRLAKPWAIVEWDPKVWPDKPRFTMWVQRDHEPLAGIGWIVRGVPGPHARINRRFQVLKAHGLAN